jgi:hypothetical protein
MLWVLIIKYNMNKYKIIIEKTQNGVRIGSLEEIIVECWIAPKIGEGRSLLVDPPIMETIINVIRLMEEQLISFKTAKLAKEKGFNEQVLDCYNTDGDLYGGNTEHILFKNKQLLETFYSAPTQSFLQKWFREVHNLELLVTCNASRWFWELNKDYPNNGGTFIAWSRDYGSNDAGHWETYEEALEIGLRKALETVCDINTLKL